MEEAFKTAAAPQVPVASPEDVALDDLRALTNRLRKRFVQQIGLEGAKDTKRYFDYTTSEYCSVNQAIRNGIRLAHGRPLIIVAHSIGTLATYRMFATALRDSVPPGTRVVRFIALGSQVGNAAFASRLSGVDEAPFPYPQVDEWINIFDVADPVAWPTYDATRNHFSPGGWGVVPPVNIPVELATAYHNDIGGYLVHPSVVRAIAAGWCRASTPQPPMCSRYAFGDVGPGSSPPGLPSWNSIGKTTTRFGSLSGIGAALGAWGSYNWSHETAVRPAAGALVGAIAGTFISAAVDRVWPSI